MICRTSLSHGLGGFAHGLGDPHVGPHRLGGVAGRRDLARRHVRPLLLFPELDQLLGQYCASRLVNQNSIRLFNCSDSFSSIKKEFFAGFFVTIGLVV